MTNFEKIIQTPKALKLLSVAGYMNEEVNA